MDERGILYDLGCRVMELAKSDTMEQRRALWRKHHSFKGDRPLIYLRAYAFDENFDRSVLRCSDPLLRTYEKQLHETLYRSTLGDDYIIEPWVTLSASYRMPNGYPWGVPAVLGEKPQSGGAAAFSPVLTDTDFSCMQASTYDIDEALTKERKEKLEEALAGSIPVFVSREGPYSMWNGDISTLLARLRGLEPLMWDLYDNPEWLHSLLAFMRDGILSAHVQAEKAGGFSLADHQNQCMPYALDMEDPDPTIQGVSRRRLWRFMASQEFTGCSPEMFWEFMLSYQVPIIEQFGMVAYGCCEDLTQKIGVLRSLKNLRRIAVSPFADAAKCAEQIGGDYVLSWRPNPSSACSYGVDEDFIRRELNTAADHFDRCGCVWDVTLKDLETTGSDPTAIVRWTKIVREELEKRYG